VKTLPPISLRVATSTDATFAYGVLERTMREYAISTWGIWLEEQARESIDREVADGNTRIIEFHSTPAGILRVERSSTHFQLEQLYIQPEYQRSGVGSAVIRLVLAEAAESGLPVELRVLRVNPAKEFYEHHGFSVFAETPERWYMRSAAS
jgi:GNAT superfamily N-acetyltransferase